jgi:ketosteroid isomerase-like protein
MKSLFTLCCLLSATLIAQAQSTTEQAVVAAEKARFEAQVARNYDELEKYLSDDLVYVHSNGQVDNKQAFVQAQRDGKSVYTFIEVVEQKVRMYGKTALINGVINAKVKNAEGKINDLKLRYTDAYQKNGKQWQLVTWQSLRLTQ